MEALEAFVVAHDVEIGEMFVGLEAVHFDQARALLRGWYDYMLASASPRWSESFQVRDGLLAQTFLAIHGALSFGNESGPVGRAKPLGEKTR